MPDSDSNANNTQTEGGRSATSCSLRDATIAVLGGVVAISPDLYTEALEQIAEMSGRENTAEMWQEVNAILQTLN